MRRFSKLIIPLVGSLFFWSAPVRSVSSSIAPSTQGCVSTCAKLIHTSLALRFRTSMVKLRAEIRAHLRGGFRNVRVPPSPDNAAEVKALLHLFCRGSDSVIRIKRLLIQTLVSSDPCGTDVVHHCRRCCAGYED